MEIAAPISFCKNGVRVENPYLELVGAKIYRMRCREVRIAALEKNA
jgi:hypothetical protein